MGCSSVASKTLDASRQHQVADLNLDLEEGAVERRDSWQGKADLLVACIASAVGLGNVWRFPYLCYKNGGGAFLIPYFLAVLVGGFPIFYLELAIGQFMGQGGARAWSIVPLFQGIGVSSLILVFLLSSYYNVIITWSVYYIYSSFASQLPWQHCGHEWNTANCSDRASDNVTMATTGNGFTDPVTEFWENKVLGITKGIDEPGSVKWDLALCLFLAWLVVYGCVCKGIKSSGKVMYVTAPAPYIFMLILLIRNSTLDGHLAGIEFYLKPNMTKLMETTVWIDAGTQIFFSWAIGIGVTTMIGSYNKFHQNSLRDSAILTVVNAMTSLLAGFIVFGILGFMAKQQNVPISQVAESGPGLAFIAYPKAVAQLPVSPLWSICFFIMLIFLGIDCQFVNVETIVTGVVDQWPSLLRRGHRKDLFVGLTCLLLCLIGLAMVTEGGVYVVQLFDFYTGSRFIILVALSEIIAVAYCYGAKQFIENIRMMIGKTPLLVLLPYLYIAWMLLTPVFCLVIFSLIVYNYSELTYTRPHRGTYAYPAWSVALGWTMGSLTIVWIPLVAIYRLVRLVWTHGSLSRMDLDQLLGRYSRPQHHRGSQQSKAQERLCVSNFEEAHHGSLRLTNGRHLGKPDDLDLEGTTLML